MARTRYQTRDRYCEPHDRSHCISAFRLQHQRIVPTIQSVSNNDTLPLQRSSIPTTWCDLLYVSSSRTLNTPHFDSRVPQKFQDTTKAPGSKTISQRCVSDPDVVVRINCTLQPMTGNNVLRTQTDLPLRCALIPKYPGAGKMR